MTIVEKMARAIFLTWKDAEGADATWEEALAGHAKPEEYPNMHRTVELARMEALAALKAIREPDEGMVAAGTARDDGADPTNAAGVFTAMIDHAIQEHEG